jgi:nucleoside-diphosphate-sugar epimerase
MRVFVTGASGFIGSTLVPELLSAGHEVLGLARSDASAEKLTAAGAEPLRGSLDDLDVLRDGATRVDGVIHLAYNHDFSQFAAAGRTDLHAIETIGTALEGTGKPFVIAAGLLGLAPGQIVTEQQPFPSDANSPMGPRALGAQFALGLAEHGVRSAVVRLAMWVHGETKRGFVGNLVDIAQATGVSGFIGDGSNRWPAVHVLDAARLFRLALESAPAGSILHGVGDEGVPVKDIAEIIGRHLDVPVASIPAEEVPAHFGAMALFVGADAAASSARTQDLLGWTPTHPGLIAVLDSDRFFDQTEEAH